MNCQKIKLLFSLIVIVFLISGYASEIWATPQANQVQDDEEFPLADDEGQINLADKSDLNVKGFIRWLSRVKEMQIFNDGQLDNLTRKLEFYGRTRVDVDVDEMFELAQAILRSNGLAIVQADVEGWYRIVPLAKTRVFAPEGKPDQLQTIPKAEYVTAVFTLSNASPDSVSQYIQQLLYVGDDKSDSISTIPGRKILIVTETAKKLIRIRDLITQLDQPRELAQPVFHKVIHLGAEELATQLKDILSQASKVSAAGAPSDQQNIPSESELSISSNLRTNELILIGTPGQIEQAMKLIRKLDVGLGLELRRYQFEFVPATRIDQLIKQSLGTQDKEAIQRIYQSTVRSESNQLIVTAGVEIHQRIDQIKQQLDVRSQEENTQSPIKFYTLKNVKANDILDTLRAVERRFREGGRRNPRLNGISTGVNFAPGGGGGFIPANGAFPQGSFPSNGNQFQGNQFQGNQFQGNPNFQDPGGGIPGEPGSLPPQQGGGASSAGQSVIPGEAKITVDGPTNTLIVVAEPAVQQLYADLIERLDVRRPQVLIEVNIVTLSDNEDFNLGIEVGGGDRAGSKRLFSFTSFGLSETSGTDGTLGLRPGLGFNGTLVDPDVADVVLRALSRHRKARVIAAPRILVNDNASGLLSSVAEVAFTSINANNTISTTSFAGFAQAGTTINVTPQISEDDYLNLEFDVLVNDFTGPGSDGVPPPRNTDQVASEVSIPDGHTVIVGGLTRRRVSEDLQGIPLIEELPILKELTNRQIKSSEGQRLFVFIKPVILRDDKFKDLRFLSELERNRATLPDDFPSSGPVLIR